MHQLPGKDNMWIFFERNKTGGLYAANLNMSKVQDKHRCLKYKMVAKFNFIGTIASIVGKLGPMTSVFISETHRHNNTNLKDAMHGECFI